MNDKIKFLEEKGYELKKDVEGVWFYVLDGDEVYCERGDVEGVVNEILFCDFEGELK